MRAGRPAQLSRRSTRPGSTWCTTASTPSCGSARRGRRTSCAATASTPTGRRSSSSGGSPGRRACPTSCGPPPSCRRTSSSCSAPARPDTPEIMAEVEALIDDLQADPRGRRLDPRDAAARRGRRAAVAPAPVFACPSIYEPLGIVNLEAMACELAVVATATGGIPEVVVDGETGWLVPIEQVQDGSGTPVDPDRFVADLAAALTDAVSDPDAGASVRAWPAGAARSSTSPGRSSATRPSRSTAPCSAEPPRCAAQASSARRGRIPARLQRADRGGGRDRPVGGRQQRGEQHPAALVGGAGQRGRVDAAARARCPG